MQQQAGIKKEILNLYSRSTEYYGGLSVEIARKYEKVLGELAANVLSEKNEVSPSAFSDRDSLSFLPRLHYPAWLRLGELQPKSSSLLNNGIIPYYHDFSEHRNLIVQGFDLESAHHLLQNIAFRLLASLEPHLLLFHFIDPTGLGQHFSYFSELSIAIKGPKILTESSQIERVLAEAKAAAVNLVQEKLTHKYDCLESYNAAAGSKLAESYRIIFIANFPAGFSQRAVETLLSIINTSSKSGIAVFMSIDQEELSGRRGLDKMIFSNSHLSVVTPQGVMNIQSQDFINANFYLSVDNRVTASAHELIKTVNEQALLIQNRTIDVDECSSSVPGQGNSADGIHIPIGLVGKDKPCILTLGAEKSGHHVLIGGATGAGKTVLLHNIIVNGAWHYSSDELVFYLLDYKEGTEFKVYENLPHVLILSMESSRAFGLSTLRYLQEEMERRGRLFKEAGISNLQDYRGTTDCPLPRLLVIIDEFQVLLQGHDRLSGQGAEMLDDISRRGRSFGIHMLLSTQTLSEVNLKTSTLSNIAVRIGLRMSETDSARLFHRENTTAATLKKPGEAYFNAAHGQSEGNLRFQVAFLDTKKIRERLKKLGQKNSKVNHQRYIFDGQHYIPFQPDRVEKFLQRRGSEKNHLYADLAISEPGYICQDVVALRLRRQYSSNVLMVGDSPADAVSLTMLMLYQLIRQSSRESRFYLADLFPVDTPWYGRLEEIKRLYSEQVVAVDNRRLGSVVDTLEIELAQALEHHSIREDRTVLVLLNVQAARIFDGKSGIGGSLSTKKLEKIVREGAEVGIHVVLHSLHYQGLEKVFTGRNLLNEFENQIVLRGGASEKMLPGDSQAIKQEGLAYLIAPQARYGIDPCRLYDPEEVVAYFQGMEEMRDED